MSSITVDVPFDRLTHAGELPVFEGREDLTERYASFALRALEDGRSKGFVFGVGRLQDIGTDCSRGEAVLLLALERVKQGSMEEAEDLLELPVAHYIHNGLPMSPEAEEILEKFIEASREKQPTSEDYVASVAETMLRAGKGTLR